MAKRNALITGANRGLGFETARQLGRHGYRVYLGCRDGSRGQVAAEALRHEGFDARALRLDVTSQHSVDQARRTLGAESGVLHALVNNAAIHYDSWQSVLDADLEIVEEALATNFLGAWRLSKAMLDLLREAPTARIVNVSSEGGSLATMRGNTPAYSSSKTALNALTRMLAAQLEGTRVQVTSVCPGWVATDMGGAGGRPVAEGAAGIVSAAIPGDTYVSGGFYRDQMPLRW